MSENVRALAVDEFTIAKTIEPMPGVVMQVICRAPSGMKGPLPTFWLPHEAVRHLHQQLGRVLREIDSDPRTKKTARPRH